MTVGGRLVVIIAMRYLTLLYLTITTANFLEILKLLFKRPDQEIPSSNSGMFVQVLTRRILLGGILNHKSHRH